MQILHYKIYFPIEQEYSRFKVKEIHKYPTLKEQVLKKESNLDSGF